MKFKRWAPCALALIPMLAGAQPIEDLRNGTDIFLNLVRATVDGETAKASGFVIPKPAGTLDLTLSMANFGMSNTQPIHATASVNGNKITWNFDKTFVPRINVDDSTDMRRAWGHVTVVVERLPADLAAQCAENNCDRNVRVRLSSPTNVWVAGEGTLGFDYTEYVSVSRLDAMGGVARPQLDSFGYYGGPYYQRSEEQFIPLAAGLTGPAPEGGTPIQFWSAAPKAVVQSPSQLISQGGTGAGTQLKLAPGFTGIFTVRATTGGARSEFALKVAPEADTDSRNNPFDVAEWVPDMLAGCMRCNTFVAHPGRDISISMLNGLPVIVEKTRLTDLNTLFNARVAPKVMDPSGWTTGTLTNSQGTFGFAANVRNRNARPTLFKGVTPVGVNAMGRVLVNSNGAVPNAGTVVNGAFTKLPFASGTKESRAVAMSNGHAVGTLVDATGSWIFRYSDGRVSKLRAFTSATPWSPVAVNNFGEVAAYSELRATRTPMRFDSRGTAQSLGTVSGYSSAWPTAQNDLGWIVGTASNGTTTTGFLWTRTGGMIDLNRMAPNPRVVVREALSVTNDKQVVVRAVVNGRDDLYVLNF